MVVSRIKKAIQDSKQKKQFRIRAKLRNERKKAKQEREENKFVDKAELKAQLKEKRSKTKKREDVIDAVEVASQEDQRSSAGVSSFGDESADENQATV